MKKMTRAFLSMLLLVCSAGLGAQDIRIDLQSDQSLYLSDQTVTAWIKIGLSAVAASSRDRKPPLNIALVLDRSGSMEGEKLQRAKEAALYAVDQLRSEDILSLVIYDTEVDVLVPATSVGNGDRFRRAIRGIEARDSTALFAGVASGGQELHKHLSADRVNRIILLSDGLANVGPDSPQALGDLGASLRREGISVTTIGLGDGYNETLMARLARSSDGNHAYVAEARDLVRIFDAEFKDAQSIAATDIRILLKMAPGVKIRRIINRDGDINGNQVELRMNQVIRGQEKYALIEVEIPANLQGRNLELAKAEVSYRDIGAMKTQNRPSLLNVSFSKDQKKVSASVRKDIREKVVLQTAVIQNEEALRLRDEGKVDEARQVLRDNAAALGAAAKELDSPALGDYAQQNSDDAEKVAAPEEEWNKARKGMVDNAYELQTQQSY